MYYANKKFLVSVARIEEDRKIVKEDFEMNVKAGELVSTDFNGNEDIISEKMFKDGYVPVKVMDEDFAASYENAYASFEGLESHLEDEEYLSGTIEIAKGNN